MFNSIFLTQVGGFFKPLAWLFGKLFNLLYEFVGLFGTTRGNVAITVILFTIVTKILMTPLTIKQQKSSRLQSLMSPELSAINKKYEGKNDQKSMNLKAAETQAVYDKYGTNMFAGCLPILLTFLVIIPMYKIIYAIPAYVDDINALYTSIAEAIKSCDGYVKYLVDISDSLGVAASKFAEYKDEGVISVVHIIDILTKFGSTEWNELQNEFPSLQIADTVQQIADVYSVGSYNILNSPRFYKVSWALLVPVLAAGTQYLQSFLSKTQTDSKQKTTSDDPMAKSLNSMLYFMPILTGVFCFSFSLCVGIYWIIGSVVTIISQLIINKIMTPEVIDAMIAKNIEKKKNLQKKNGISFGSRMAELAKAQTRSINDTKSISSYTNAKSVQNNLKDSDTNSSTNVESNSTIDSGSKKGVSYYASLGNKKND